MKNLQWLFNLLLFCCVQADFKFTVSTQLYHLRVTSLISISTTDLTSALVSAGFPVTNWQYGFSFVVVLVLFCFVSLLWSG